MRNGRNASTAILRIFMVAQNIRWDSPRQRERGTSCGLIYFHETV